MCVQLRNTKTPQITPPVRLLSVYSSLLKLHVISENIINRFATLKIGQQWTVLSITPHIKVICICMCKRFIFKPSPVATVPHKEN